MSQMMKNLLVKIRIIYYFGKIIGLSPYKIDQNVKLHFSFCGTMYSILLSISYIILCLYLMHQEMLFHNKTTITAFLASECGIIFQCGAIVVAWLQIAFNQLKIDDMISSLKCVHFFEKKMDTDESQNLYILDKFLNLIFVLNFAYFVLLSSTILFRDKFSVISLIYNLLHVVNHNWIFVFIQFLCFLQQKFDYVNFSIKKLTKICKKSGNSLP